MHSNRFLKAGTKCNDKNILKSRQNVFQIILVLHWTFSVAAFEVSLPTLFSATHRYSPLSVLCTFVIVNCFLSSEKLILPVAFKADPFLVHDIVSSGLPVALQDKVTLSPSVTVSPRG